MHVTNKRGSPKNKWTAAEDQIIIQQVNLHGAHNWTQISNALPGRTGKQCRERWIFALCPELNKDKWGEEEDKTLIELQKQFGNKWSYISKFLPGRSTSAIKNRWSLIIRHNQGRKRDSKNKKNVNQFQEINTFESNQNQEKSMYPFTDADTFEQIWSRVDDLAMSSLFSSMFKLP